MTIRGLSIAVAMLAPLAATASHAADPAYDPAASEWRFSVAPYVWGAGLDGEVGIFNRQPIDVDLSFSDILENLKFAGMGIVEAHNGTWGILGDVTYVTTEAEESFERDLGLGNVSLNATLDTQTFIGTVMGEYRLVNSDAMSLDLLGGVRFWDVNLDVGATLALDGTPVASVSGSDGDNWVDPMAGFKTRINTNSPLYFTGWALVGGGVFGSNVSWDAMGGIGYQWSDRFSTVLAYRAIGVDYENDGFVYDTVQHGAALGAVINF